MQVLDPTSTDDLESDALMSREMLSRLGVIRQFAPNRSEAEWLLMDFMFLNDLTGMRLSEASFCLFPPGNMTIRWTH